MAEHCDELFTKVGDRLAINELGLRDVDPIFCVQMVGDQLGKKREGANDLGIVDLMRMGIDGAECSKELTIGQNDRH